MPPLFLLLIYCVLIVLASLGGGMLPSLLHLTHRRMQMMVSFVGGLMLGIALFHLLPHAVAEGLSLDQAVWWMMIGLLTTFFLIRVFHFHQHEHAELTPESAAQPYQTDATGGSSGSAGGQRAAGGLPTSAENNSGLFAHATDANAGSHHSESGEAPESEAADHRQHHGRHPHHHAHPAKESEYRYGWVGVAFGLALHTAIDGIALAAHVAADAGHAEHVYVLGLGTFLAVVLHKPLDAMSITSLMAAEGWPRRGRQLVNAAYASMCPLGAFCFYFGFAQRIERLPVVGGALAFAAGVFLCISLGDLLPEVTFHTHDRLKLSILLLLGVTVAFLIGFVEPSHLGHEHGVH